MIKWIRSLFRKQRDNEDLKVDTNGETNSNFVILDEEPKNWGTRSGYDRGYNIPNPISDRPLPTLKPPPEELDLNEVPKGTKLPYFGPNLFAEITAVYPAEVPFSCLHMNGTMSQIWRSSVGHPTFYVETEDGHITYMVSADSPQEGAKLIASWPLYKPVIAVDIQKYAHEIAEWLSDRAQNFTSIIPPVKEMEGQIKNALNVQSIDEVEISVKLSVETNQPMDGQKLWHAMHDLGFNYGAHEFEFYDPFLNGDPLITGAVYDKKGFEPYMEDIEKGDQNFETVTFYFNGLRTRSPTHVLEMIRSAVKELQTEFGGSLEYKLNGQIVEGFVSLESAIDHTVKYLSALNLKAGSGAVQMLH